MSPEPFLTSLTARIYKLIPMRDDAEAGANVFKGTFVIRRTAIEAQEINY